MSVVPPASPSSAALHPKVSGAILGGAISIILVYCINEFAHVTLPADVASALSTICSAAVGYLTPSN